MAISDLGINKDDFEFQAFEDLKQIIIRTPRTKTISNYTGSPTYTDGTNENIYGIFRKRSQSFDWVKEGLFEGGDAFLQVKLDQILNKEDYITVGTEKFRVDNIIMRTIGGVNIFKVSNLFLVD